MTKREMFESLLTLVNGTEYVDNKADLISGLTHELEMLERKAAAPKKPTAIQKANQELRPRVLEALSETPQTVSDILGILGDPTLTNQRITHMLTGLVTEGLAKREVVKRKAYYTVA